MSAPERKERGRAKKRGRAKTFILEEEKRVYLFSARKKVNTYSGRGTVEGRRSQNTT